VTDANAERPDAQDETASPPGGGGAASAGKAGPAAEAKADAAEAATPKDAKESKKDVKEAAEAATTAAAEAEVTAVDAEATEEPAADAGAEGGDEHDEDDAEGRPVYAELATLKSDLGELTSHLQRVTAEYANYRKRVDRDRTLAGEQAIGTVLTQLLPVLDDLDRARDHGDLVGPFGSVAEQLTAALTKFGLTAFGSPGDPFDPTMHEAVSHTSSPEVTETTCVEVHRRGYLLGERLLRPALVAVADPE